MNILVTGGAGFIGSHLAKRLLKENYNVYVVDCLHPYYDPVRKQHHLEQISREDTFHFFEHQLLEQEKTEALFKKIQPDVVIHLAALPGVAYSIEAPLAYVDYDVKATINVLEAAAKSGCRRVIFASSSSVYGNQKGPCQESMANGHVLSPYAAAKFSAESFCHVYESLWGLNVQILRFFTVYGPWGRPDMAIGIFLKKILANEPITLFGEGRTRDFTYIDDIISGIMAAITHPEKKGIFNIGSASPVPMESLLGELKRHFPDMQVKRESERAGDVQNTWANIEKAQSELGFAPSISFREGLERTVEWARTHEHLL